ncbi:MAG: GDYXXLXY domain-containing protein [Bacteroidia bacterium]|nr:GDYXXLXY domain-containing protein [Bacteroidia bacterium]
MRNNKVWFLIYAAVLLMAFLGFVFKHESTFRNAVECRFKCTFYDPVHPFSGRYLNLNFETFDVPVTDTVSPENGLHVLLGTDSLGYTVPVTAQYAQPVKGKMYITLVGDQYNDIPVVEPKQKAFGRANIRLPFNRFYVPEEDAPKAEKLIAQANSENKAVWISVFIMDGKYKVEEVYIEDKTLHEILHP